MRIKRDISAAALRIFSEYPILVVTGPRQSGKTTLVRELFPSAQYVNLESPDVREAVRLDPRGYLAAHPAPVIFDEVQNFPELLSYLQVLCDERGENGLYVLTGSYQPALQQAISQSLAGRCGLVELLPLSLAELHAHGIDKSRDEWIADGFMPRLYDKPIRPLQLYRDYFRTYVERDVRSLANLRHLATFEKFVRLLAGRVGQILNLNSLAGDVGVSPTTIKEWLSILEASYVIYILRPYYANCGKRLVKAPKVYFVETALAAYLIGITDKAQLATHPLTGNLFENMVVMEMVKTAFNRGDEARLGFLRTSNGLEADVVEEMPEGLVLSEIKSTATFHSSLLKGLHAVAKFLPGVIAQRLIYIRRSARNRDRCRGAEFLGIWFGGMNWVQSGIWLHRTSQNLIEYVHEYGCRSHKECVVHSI